MGGENKKEVEWKEGGREEKLELSNGNGWKEGGMGRRKDN